MFHKSGFFIMLHVRTCIYRSTHIYIFLYIPLSYSLSIYKDTDGKGGAVSCSRPGDLCHGKKGNPEREHCKRDSTHRECHKNGGHERGGEEDPIHKRHGHEHGGVVVEPIHGGKGHGHERGGEGDPNHGAHCKPGENNRACYRHGGHERGGEQDPIHKGHGHEHGGLVVDRPEQPVRPGGPGTAETETKN